MSTCSKIKNIEKYRPHSRLWLTLGIHRRERNEGMVYINPEVYIECFIYFMKCKQMWQKCQNFKNMIKCTSLFIMLPCVFQFYDFENSFKRYTVRRLLILQKMLMSGTGIFIHIVYQSA